MIRIGIPLIGGGIWTGGLVYLKNTLKLVHERLSDSLEPVVFLSRPQAEAFGNELAAIPGTDVVVETEYEKPGRGTSLARALLLGADRNVESMLRRSCVDVVFESATFYGWRLSIPAIAWMPDFQHRYMPELFSTGLWWRRDIGFRVQVATGRTIMVSSFTAQKDCERFYPASRGHTQVVRFAMNMDIARAFSRTAELRGKYALPQRFIYLPNQFWRHKNHEIVVDALSRLKESGQLAYALPIVASGLPKDTRYPTYFDDVMRRASEAGVESHFRFLGLIPYEDVLGLTAACDVQINPSFFEGWSTPIEESKALGTPLLLSDLPVHREQAPGARFFDPRSADACAAALREASRGGEQRPSLEALTAAQDERLAEHARAFREMVEAATKH